MEDMYRLPEEISDCEILIRNCRKITAAIASGKSPEIQ